MDFWLMDVKMETEVDGNNVAFDFINTYFDKNEAIDEAKILSENMDVIEVSVHHWLLKPDGTREHVETGNWKEDIPYHFSNSDHRFFKEV